MKRKNRIRQTVGLAALFLCAAISVKAIANPGVRRPVVQFIYFYQQSEVSQDMQELSLWDRVLYSVLMTKASNS